MNVSSTVVSSSIEGIRIEQSNFDTSSKMCSQEVVVGFELTTFGWQKNALAQDHQAFNI